MMGYDLVIHMAFKGHGNRRSIKIVIHVCNDHGMAGHTKHTTSAIGKFHIV